MKNTFLALSIATVTAGAACLAVGISEMSNFDKATRSMDNATASNLFLGGLIGAHLSVIPLTVAGRID